MSHIRGFKKGDSSVTVHPRDAMGFKPGVTILPEPEDRVVEVKPRSRMDAFYARFPGYEGKPAEGRYRPVF